jgi:hypothetical protein
VFVSVHPLRPSRPRSIHSRPKFSKRPVSIRHPNPNNYMHYSFTYRFSMPHSSHSPWFDHLHNIWRRLPIMTLIIIHLLSSSCYPPLYSHESSAPNKLFSKIPSLWPMKHYSNKLKQINYSSCCLMYSSLNIESLLLLIVVAVMIIKPLDIGIVLWTYAMICRRYLKLFTRYIKTISFLEIMLQ